MAKRKKTPDILSDLADSADPRGEAPRTAALKETATGKYRVSPPGRTATRRRKKADPLAAVFPPQQTPPPLFSARVKLTVAVPESIKSAVETGVAQELHSLGDVRLTAEEAEWRLVILGVELQTKRGERYGVALSVVVLHDRLRLQEAGHPPLHTGPTHASDFRGMWLRAEAREHLQQLCHGIVTDFNAKYLDAQRTAYRQLLDTYQKRQSDQAPHQT